MFTIYYSNDLDVQKNILLSLMENKLDDPFQSEVVLVQSPGMAQWLQWKIAEKKGIASNIEFPMPASFIWQQYAENLPNVESQTHFNKVSMTWRLMRLIPTYLQQPEFHALRYYLASSVQSEQQKLYQLAHKIADLFDQYLVYRPEWISSWEADRDAEVSALFRSPSLFANEAFFQQLTQDIRWQGVLWRALVADIQSHTHLEMPIHRANLQEQFLMHLRQGNGVKLPSRLFVFGISALPKGYLETLYAMSLHCDVHFFFTNGCREYWGDLIDTRFIRKLSSLQRTSYFSHRVTPVLTKQVLESAEQNNEHDEFLIGHPLLSNWGKLGRDFLYLLTELEQRDNVQSIDVYTTLSEPHLLSQVQSRILHLDGQRALNFIENDRTLTFHSCHSLMREVEVLHDYLLHLFQQDSDLTPKEIVVMVVDIDKYTPYIQAVFGQQSQNVQTAIPFSISDTTLSEQDVLIASFLRLLTLNENQFSAEEVLALLDIPAIRAKFEIELVDLAQIRHWVTHSGIRFGLDKQESGQTQPNYNAWQAGLERMLLGYAMREEHGIWQESLAFDSSYGLQGELTGRLAEFLATLSQWHQDLQLPQTIEQWHVRLTACLTDFFFLDENNASLLLYLQEVIEEVIESIKKTNFEQVLTSEVLAEVLRSALAEHPNTMRFLAGKVNFCTLLPMRSIPFKVVCLLGMNDGEYPRQQIPNSFDLMQYDRRKGDRFRRDDDCYLFLEALLSAQEYFYVSFVGRSIIDNQIKEPSVLVSQLLDYLVDKLLPKDNGIDWRERLVKQHPMTAFSSDNFQGAYRSFAKQWLPLAALQKRQAYDNFVQPIAQPFFDEDREIALSDFIAFVQHPVAFFFKRRLGVSFTEQETSIPESENFTLDNLTQYLINDQLIYCSGEEIETFFAQLKVKGILPRGEFAQIYAQQQKESIQALRNTIADYVSQDEQILSVDLALPTSLGHVRLTGQIGQLYDNRRVSWRVGSIKDKHVIEAWIYYLVQCVLSDSEVCKPPIYYSKEGQKTFKPLESNHELSIREQAFAQLCVYAESYVQSYHDLQLVPTVNIKSYLKTIEEDSAVDFQRVLMMLHKLGQTDDYVTGDIYWQRILAQQEWDETLLNEINERTRAWFKLMITQLSS